MPLNKNTHGTGGDGIQEWSRFLQHVILLIAIILRENSSIWAVFSTTFKMGARVTGVPPNDHCMFLKPKDLAQKEIRISQNIS